MAITTPNGSWLYITARAVLSYHHGVVSIELAGHTREGSDTGEAFELGLRVLERGLARPSLMGNS